MNKTDGGGVKNEKQIFDFTLDFKKKLYLSYLTLTSYLDGRKGNWLKKQ